MFVLFGTLQADEKKPAKPEKKTGTVTGAVTAKEKNWIEVKADGEEKARRYTPRWIGNAGGGLDKDMLKQFADLKIGSRVRMDWEFDERARAVKIEVLKEASKKE
jgi:hypothetical protein